MNATLQRPDISTDLSQATPLAPGSLFWRHFGDSRFMLFFIAGLTIEVAHPVIGQGVKDYSTFKTDPWGRLERSLALLWPVVYNTPTGALDYGRRLREMHRGFKGKLPNGKSYSAFHVEAYLWVHMNVFDAVYRIALMKEGRLSNATINQLYEEWLRMGILLDIRPQDMPPDVTAFWQRYNDIIDHKLVMNETLDFLLGKDYYVNVPKPEFIPSVIWRVIRIPVGNVLWLLTRGAFPERFRTKFQVPWSKIDTQLFKSLISGINIGLKLLPERLNYLPVAYAALIDARHNPQHYQLLLPQSDNV
jgi:uncharacterized protein (DUF2236 family)